MDWMLETLILTGGWKPWLWLKVGNPLYIKDHHYLYTHCGLLRYFWTNHSHSIRLETLPMTGGWKPLLHKWTWGWKPWLEIGNHDNDWRLENFQPLYVNGLEVGDPDHDWRLETLIITGGWITFEHKWIEGLNILYINGQPISYPSLWLFHLILYKA